MVHDPVEALERMFPPEEDRVLVKRHGPPARGQDDPPRVRNGTDAWFDKTERR